MECMYSYINLSIPTRNFNENILLIKVDKKHLIILQSSAL
ncbi:unknown [Phascolarctobacterium succinatutens CAG:287]|uniref:Uncharacterized protein n=1 Tax=Phascolarctobacterium succinatutens CAG:287 TaxID=1263101 RepID=R6WIH5_9FIRM|nr:unknown [Phascolarctobacterium succinatutens CAG:287]